MLKKKISKAEYDKLSDPLKAFYQADGEIFVVKAEHEAFSFEVEDVTGLKTALTKERDAREALDKALKAFKDDAGNPVKAEDVKSAYARLSQVVSDKERLETDIERVKTQMATAHQAEITKEKNKTAAVLKALEKRVVENECLKAIDAAKGKAKVLLPHVRQFVRMVEKGGDYVAEVIDDKGTARVADGNGSPFTIDALVSELKNDPDYAPNFEASGASGGGAGGGSGAGAGGGSDRRGAGAGGSVRKVSSHDQDAMNASIEDIATGKAVVVAQ